MGTAQTAAVVLRRGVRARLVGGSRLHPWITALLVVDIVLAVTLSAAGITAGSVEVTYYAAAVLLLIWAFGAAAHARAEPQAMWWRYVLRHGVMWKDVTAVRFGATSRRLFGRGSRPSIRVAFNGVEQEITPALGVPGDRLRQFASGIAGLASDAGVKIEYTDPFWDPVRHGQPR